MHPALSVILLTTLLGAGQGLFLALYTGQVYSVARILPPQDATGFYTLGSVVSLAFLVAGLVASFFHLGRPERAWRSATRWRTSWLSREVLVLPAVIGLVGLYGLAHHLGWSHPLFLIAGTYPVDLTLLLGLFGMLVTLTLFVCTAMIYAAVRFLEEWHSPLTVLNYLLLGTASGFTLAAAFSAYVSADLVRFYGLWAVVLTTAALVTRGAALLRNARLRHRSTVQSAIGVRHPRIQQKSQGATGGSFNTREFFHGRSPELLRRVRLAFLVLTFPLPVALLAAAYALSSPTIPFAAFAVQYLGLLAERWYFFADARHPQNLYYQSVA
jgi:DMSO reductase anchor subunit